jgi:thiol-disulfide isomerase/thioredoxin
MTEAHSPPNRKLMYVAIALALFWLFCLKVFLPARPNDLENTGLSEPADYNWTLADLDGQAVPFAKFKGKTVFLNIWATWCGPCVGEMPSIAKLARDPRLQGKNIEFVCVSIAEPAETVRRFLTDKHWTMTILRGDNTPAVFASDGIPATFLIDPDGRIAATKIGAADWNEPGVVAFLEKLASTPTKPR